MRVNADASTILTMPASRRRVPVDLTSSTERARLSRSATLAFLSIVDHWHLSDHEATLLLGIAAETYRDMKKTELECVLSSDTLIRISYLIGIFRALNILHGTKLSKEWVKLANRNGIFRGATPLDYMIKGGVPALHIVRKLLDARQHGQ